MDKRFSNQVTVCGTVETARETESRVGDAGVKAVVARINTGHGTVNCWASGSVGDCIQNAYKREQPVEITGFLRNGKESHYYVRTTYAAFSPKKLNVSEVTALAKLTAIYPIGDGNVSIAETVNTSFLKSSQSVVKTYIKFLINKEIAKQLEAAGIGCTIAFTGHFSSKKKGEKWYTNITPDKVEVVQIAEKKTQAEQAKQEPKAPEKPLFNGKTAIQDFVASLDEQNNIVFQEAFRLRSMAEQLNKKLRKMPKDNAEEMQKMKDEAVKHIVAAAKVECEWAESLKAQMSKIAEHYTRKAVADGTARDEIGKEAFRAFISKRLSINGYLMPNYCGMATRAKRKPTFDDFYEDARLGFNPSMGVKKDQNLNNNDLDNSLANSR